MKDNSNIDDIFRSRLEGIEVPPPGKSWDSLAADLDKKQALRKRNNRFRFFLYSALIFLIGFVAYIYNPVKKVADEVNNEKSASTRPILKDENPVSSAVASTSNDVIEKNKIHRTISEENARPEEKNSFSDEAYSQPLASSGSSITSKDPVPAVSSSEKEKSESGSVNDQSFKIEDNSIASAREDKNKNVATMVPAQTSIHPEPAISRASDTGIDTGPETVIPLAENKIESKAVTEPANAEEKILQGENTPSSAGENDVTKNRVAIVTGKEIKDQNGKNSPGGQHSSAAEVNSKEEKPAALAVTEPTPAAQPVSDSNVSEQKTESSKSLLKTIVSHLSAEVYYSPDYVNNHLKKNTDYTGTASQDINDYENSEAAFSYSTGVNVFYDLGSKWSIGSGIAYSTFSQTAVYNTISVIADTIYQDVHGRGDPQQGGGGGSHGGGSHGGGHGGGHGGSNPHRPPPGNGDNHYVVNTPCGAIDLYKEPPHQNSGNLQNGDTLKIKTETSESIQFINVPLMVRYNFGNNKFKYFVSGGGSVNFVRGDQVKVVVNDSYTETNEHDGLKSMNYSLTLGIGVQYNFYRRVNVFLNPTFRYSITPVNQYNPMDAYPYFIGIGAGLSVHF